MKVIIINVLLTYHTSFINYEPLCDAAHMVIEFIAAGQSDDFILLK